MGHLSPPEPRLRVELRHGRVEERAAALVAEVPGGDLQVSGGGECPILPFTGEISYRYFTGSQKYFGGPVKSPYEISPVKVYFAYSPPPHAQRLAPVRPRLHRQDRRLLRCDNLE